MEKMEGDNWNNESDESDEEIKSPTMLAYERKASVIMKSRQLMKFSTMPCKPKAGSN